MSLARPKARRRRELQSALDALSLKGLSIIDACVEGIGLAGICKRLFCGRSRDVACAGSSSTGAEWG